MDNYITIRKGDNHWYADFAKHADSASLIHQLFNGYIVPLPFTAQASAASVIRDLQRRNPDYDIRVSDNG